MLQSHCPKGHNLLSSVLASRERVIPWGAPQIEDRALETAQTEWQGYQDRLGETKVQVEQALTRVQQLEGLFQSLDQWLVDIELKVKVRNHRRSDVTAKEAQLQHLKVRCIIIIPDEYRNTALWFHAPYTVDIFLSFPLFSGGRLRLLTVRRRWKV